MPSVYIAKDDGVALLDFDLKSGRSYTIGRSSMADVRLEAQSISRLHALLFEHGGIWKLTDLGSTKGLRTKEGVLKNRTLTNGDWVAIGPAVIWFFDEKEEMETGAGLSQLDMDADTDIISKPSPENQHMTLLHVRHRETGAKNLVGLTRKSILIGADTSCDIQLDGTGIENLHAVLFRLEKTWFITTSEQGQVLDTSGMPSECAELSHEKTSSIGSLEFKLCLALIPAKLEPQNEPAKSLKLKKPRDSFDIDLTNRDE
ncbi:MAG: FHA domain-containing protein [Phycisphaerales bacterium]|nr:FHA domain-containing protein [Phycisphaerales bacterium]